MRINKAFDPSDGYRQDLSRYWGYLWKRFDVSWWAFRLDGWERA